MLNYYNGSTVMTDAIGNTIYDGTFTYTWQHGRQLASAIKSGTTVSYKYNADGIRTSKTVNGILHTYDLSGTSIVRECIYNSTGTYVATELRYYYDAKGAPTAMRVFKKANVNATPQEFVCYFATNLQGDIVALYDEAGNRIASYTYDAWGNNIYKNSTATPDISTADAQWLMNINPFRYRGYYYDTDTGLYYLQSRYYNPIWGRFINADIYISTGQGVLGCNMFAYCNNSPIAKSDKNGEIWNIVIGAAVGGLVGGLVSATFQLLDAYAKGEQDVWKSGTFWAHIGVAVVGGAISGGLAASGAILPAQIVVNAAIGLSSSLLDTAIDDVIGDDESITLGTYALNAAIGTTVGTLAGLLGGPGTATKHLTNSFKRVLSNGNYSYYFSQIGKEALKSGIKAIPGILKATLPTVGKDIFEFLITANQSEEFVYD